MTPIVDCHTHTSFSDGEPTLDEVVRAAAVTGCSTLVTTDHLTLPASMDPDLECQVPEARLAERREAFEQARGLARELTEEGGTPLELVYGYECDWYPGCEENIRRWSAGAVVLLGSVHWIGDPGDVHAGAAGSVEARETGVAQAGLPGTDAGWIDYAEDKHVWEQLGVDEVWHRYVDAWCQACACPVGFDSMAHPDLAMRFANEGYPATMDLSPLWDQMAACAHDCGRRIEVSTAGLRKSVGAYYPSVGLLERFHDADVPITVGSDAHRACDVCWGIRDAYRYAHAAGYRAIEVPHADGSWESVPLE